MKMSVADKFLLSCKNARSIIQKAKRAPGKLGLRELQKIFNDLKLLFFKLKGWRLQSKDMRKASGLASYDTKTISFSKFIFTRWSKREIMNVFIHEVAHALLTYKHQHDENWTIVDRFLGGSSKVYCPIFYKPHYYFDCKCSMYRVAYGPSRPVVCSECGCLETRSRKSFT